MPQRSKIRYTRLTPFSKHTNALKNNINNIISYSAQGILNGHNEMPASFYRPSNLGVIEYNNTKHKSKTDADAHKSFGKKSYNKKSIIGMGKHVLLLEPTNPWYNSEIYKKLSDDISSKFSQNLDTNSKAQQFNIDNNMINKTHESSINKFHIISLSLFIIIIFFVCTRRYLNNRTSIKDLQ